MPIDPEFTRHAKWGKWRILADSANAKHRFGFAGAPMSPVTQNLPKPSDLWFMEFTTVTDGSKNNLEQIGVLARQYHLSQYKHLVCPLTNMVNVSIFLLV